MQKFADLESLWISHIRLEDREVFPRARQSLQLSGCCFVANDGENRVVTIGTKLCDVFELNSIVSVGSKTMN